mmetsp:Transcript_105094/g.334631  ORF Transcript_105094/g.334631 Transcript_105094/m.334631 type:complete len:241 (+) Transcript_105094:460-1182(+)
MLQRQQRLQLLGAGRSGGLGLWELRPEAGVRRHPVPLAAGRPRSGLVRPLCDVGLRAGVPVVRALGCRRGVCDCVHSWIGLHVRRRDLLLHGGGGLQRATPRAPDLQREGLGGLWGCQALGRASWQHPLRDRPAQSRGPHGVLAGLRHASGAALRPRSPEFARRHVGHALRARRLSAQHAAGDTARGGEGQREFQRPSPAGMARYARRARRGGDGLLLLGSGQGAATLPSSNLNCRSQPE